MSEEIKKEKGGSELADLKGLVSALREDIDSLKQKPAHQSVLRKHTQVHEAFLREFEKDGEVVGIVMKVHDIKEVKDKSEAKKLMGICQLDIRNPQNGREFTEKDVNWLEFLQQSKKVKAKILKRESVKRIETDERKGGGGIGTLRVTDKQGLVIQEVEHAFEVEFEDNTFYLEILDGAYAGFMLETKESALNI